MFSKTYGNVVIEDELSKIRLRGLTKDFEMCF